MLFFGIALAVLGLVLAIVSGLADLTGIGANQAEFGWKQIAGLIVGFTAIDVVPFLPGSVSAGGGHA